MDGAVQKLCCGPSRPGQYLEVSEQDESLELDSLVLNILAIYYGLLP